MASNDLSAAVAAAEDEKFGFKRSEMFKEKLAGTVNAYDRHVFLCKTPRPGRRASKALCPIRSLSSSPPLSKLARTTSPLSN